MRKGSDKERREFERHVVGREAPIPVRATVRPGREVRLVDLSRGGALIQTTSRLLPGSLADLQVKIGGWQWAGSGRVVRCQVWTLPVEERVWYRAALHFLRAMEPAAHTHVLGGGPRDFKDGRVSSAHGG